MNAQEYYRQGLLRLEAGELDAAHDLLLKALELAPDHPDIIGDVAVVYFHQRKFELSMIFLNRAQELDPGNGYRYSSRAYIKDKLGDVEGAIEDYQKAIEIDPEDSISYNNLGLAEERLGYLERAKMRYKKADELREEEERKKAEGNENDKTEFVMIPSGRNAEEEAKEEKPLTKKSIIRSVFTSGKGLRDFFRFIFNGFRIKE